MTRPHSFMAAPQTSQDVRAPRLPSAGPRALGKVQRPGEAPMSSRPTSTAYLLPSAQIRPRQRNDVEMDHRQSITNKHMKKQVRTIPRSRHSRSSSPDGQESCEGETYLPHKMTAEGFPVNNKLKRAKYATSIDDRGYLTVYEFQLNDQTIMWDHATGFVHLTGIWKALGNSKADIVRLVDNHPELEGVIRRIRGGFLKIQGTWVPYDLCRRLAVRTCFAIRHALISVFGADFPEDCLKPGVKGYGTLTLDDSGLDKKRKKRKLVSIDADEYQSSGPNVAIGERERRPRLAHVTRIASPSAFSERSASPALSEGLPTFRVTMDKTSPPRLPRVVDLTSDGSCPSRPELLDLLRASRSLQKLSAGGAEDWNSEGGRFNIAGDSTTFIWDGSDALEILEPAAWTSMDRSTGWDTPPRMTRKYSSGTQDSSLGDYPVTPPQEYPVISCDISRVPELKGQGLEMEAVAAVAPYHPSSYSLHAKTMTGNHPEPRLRTGGIDILGGSWR